MNEKSTDPTFDSDPTFDWHFEATSIAGRTVSLAVASDPDGMLIDACERQDAGEEGVIDPFWAATWRAAAGLDQYLERIDLQHKRVLELGCGTGHAGMAACLRGAEVTMTDGVDDPLQLVQLSVDQFMATVEADPARFDLIQKPKIRLLRFGIDRIEGARFPLILGSDVTYLRALWPVLDECLRDHLLPGGVALLSDPFRIIGNEFREFAKSKSWDYTEHTVTLSDDADHPIRIMELKLSG